MSVRECAAVSLWHSPKRLSLDANRQLHCGWEQAGERLWKRRMHATQLEYCKEFWGGDATMRVPERREKDNSSGLLLDEPVSMKTTRQTHKSQEQEWLKSQCRGGGRKGGISHTPPSFSTLSRSSALLIWHSMPHLMLFQYGEGKTGAQSPPKAFVPQLIYEATTNLITQTN